VFAAQPSALYLTIDLSDGCRLMGESSLETVTLHAPYGTLSLPLSHVRKIRSSEDRETATLTMTNGDDLQGVIALKDIELETIFGKIQVPVIHVLEVSVQESGLDRGLVAHYPLDEDARDNSGNGNDGKSFGGIETVDGRIGKAFGFDGVDDYVDLGNTIIEESPFSFSMWIRTENDKYANCILGNYVGYSYKNIGLHLVLYGSEVQNGPYVQLKNSHEAINNFASLADGKWHHIVGVYNENEHSLYLDGVHIETKKGSYSLTSEKLLLGKARYLKSDAEKKGYLKGAIDDLRIYNRALNRSEITALCKTGTGE
jgi:hypothetical protein